MIGIQPLTTLTAADLARLITGYTSDAYYAVSKCETPAAAGFQLQLTPRQPVYRKHFDVDLETLERYRALAGAGYSFGAYADDELVGLALAEPHRWNGSLWIWELHVLAGYQRQGVGRRLIEAAAERGRAAGLRIVVCETQNTNVPAINFYRAAGFALEGLDLSLYTNADHEPGGEVALFMKRRLV